MPSDRTTVTELGTALGMLGATDIDVALRSRTPVMHSLSPEMWDRLTQLRAGGAFDTEFHAALENGRAFLAAEDGLRGRRPNVVEWKGTGRAPGDEVAPIDLRVDHVYLVSCKYLSAILFNVSPSHLFDDLLVGRGAADRAARSGWPETGTPRWLRRSTRSSTPRSGGPRSTGRHHGHLDRGRTPPAFRRVDPAGCRGVAAGPRRRRRTHGRRRPPPRHRPGLPACCGPCRRRRPCCPPSSARRWACGCDRGGPASPKRSTPRLSEAVAGASVRRWEHAMDERGGNGEAILWRLLRMGGAPYFVLGSSPSRSLRLRIATAWDWRQQFQLISITMEPQAGGQPRVTWSARWCGTG